MANSTHFSSVTIAPTNKTASFTVDPGTSGKVTTLNAAAGLTATLPAATGSGARYEFFIGTTVTSNNVVIQVANANDTMSGVAMLLQDAADTIAAFETASTSDTITMNGTTKGGILGDFITLIDVAANKWYVKVVASATGTEATPFSAAV